MILLCLFLAFNLFAFKTSFASNLRRHLASCNAVTTPYLIDWTNTYTTAVKNAGLCLNAGWAFAVAEQIESDTMRIHNIRYTLSPQQLLDCVYSNDGCSSGNLINALNYASNGLYSASSYPYTSYYGLSQSCAENRINAVVKLSAYFTQLTNNEQCMAHYVQTTGPLIVCVSVSPNWYKYTSGIMDLSSCPTTSSIGITHCLQAVGVYPTSTNGYWKLKNNVGTNWGEMGYIRLAYGTNTCGITKSPIYTTTTINF